jgi:hypothetical protein
MTYLIIYLFIGILVAAFIDVLGDIHFNIKEKIGLTIGWPYFLVIGLKELFSFKC